MLGLCRACCSPGSVLGLGGPSGRVGAHLKRYARRRPRHVRVRRGWADLAGKGQVKQVLGRGPPVPAGASRQLDAKGGLRGSRKGKTRGQLLGVDERSQTDHMGAHVFRRVQRRAHIRKDSPPRVRVRDPNHVRVGPTQEHLVCRGPHGAKAHRKRRPDGLPEPVVKGDLDKRDRLPGHELKGRHARVNRGRRRGYRERAGQIKARRLGRDTDKGVSDGTQASIGCGARTADPAAGEERDR